MSATEGLPVSISVGSTMEEIDLINLRENRRLYLRGEIVSADDDDTSLFGSSVVSRLIDDIFWFNRMDQGIEPEEREPIMMYINSPGGDLTEGLALISAIELSKTPIYTVNIGQWSSLSFLVGITGKKRFSLPNMTFLLHDGFGIASGSLNKIHDRMEHEHRIEVEVIKDIVLRNSTMTSEEYEALKRVEFYMLPKDAKKYGFIDEIVTDIDIIL